MILIDTGFQPLACLLTGRVSCHIDRHQIYHGVSMIGSGSTRNSNDAESQGTSSVFDFYLRGFVGGSGNSTKEALFRALTAAVFFFPFG